MRDSVCNMPKLFLLNPGDARHWMTKQCSLKEFNEVLNLFPLLLQMAHVSQLLGYKTSCSSVSGGRFEPVTDNTVCT